MGRKTSMALADPQDVIIAGKVVSMSMGDEDEARISRGSSERQQGRGEWRSSTESASPSVNEGHLAPASIRTRLRGRPAKDVAMTCMPTDDSIFQPRSSLMAQALDSSILALRPNLRRLLNTEVHGTPHDCSDRYRFSHWSGGMVIVPFHMDFKKPAACTQCLHNRSGETILASRGPSLRPVLFQQQESRVWRSSERPVWPVPDRQSVLHE